MKSNKGSSIKELLIVFVILGITISIVLLRITTITLICKKNAFEIDTKIVIRCIEYEMLANEALDVTTINETNIKKILRIEDGNYEKVLVTLKQNKPYVVIRGKNKWNELVSYGDFDNIHLVNENQYSKVIKQLQL